MYGDGTIWYSESKKKWFYEYRDENQKKHRRLFKTEREAKAYKKEIRSAKNDNIPTSYTTVGEWVIKFITTYKKPRLQATSWAREKQTAAKLGPIAKILLAKLTGEEVQTLLNTLGTTLSSSTVNKVKKQLNAAYAKAIALKMVNYNPVKSCESIQEKRQPIELYTYAELRKILRVAKYNKYLKKYYLLVLTCLVTGMRIGEIMALRWEDVDFKKQEITVRKNKKNLPGIVIGSVKTPAGDHRVIPLVFKNYIKRLEAYRATSKSNLIFVTGTGTPYSHNNLKHTWERIEKWSGTPHKTWHILRHTFATHALSKGIPLLEVSRIIGHANGSTTLNKYGHAIPGYNDKIREIFSGKKTSQSDIFFS
ncbi:MAG: site-specific integrase [Bacteroidales bacterium]